MSKQELVDLLNQKKADKLAAASAAIEAEFAEIINAVVSLPEGDQSELIKMLQDQVTMLQAEVAEKDKKLSDVNTAVKAVGVAVQGVDDMIEDAPVVEG